MAIDDWGQIEGHDLRTINFFCGFLVLDALDLDVL